MRIVGVDLGQRRIGIAVSDASGTLATPVCAIRRGSSDDAAVASICAAVAELGRDEAVSVVVVGLPRRLDGTANQETPRVVQMIALLSDRLGLAVVPQDERLTSIEAEQRLALTERDWRKRKGRLDAAAAAIILQDYLDLRAAARAAEEHE